MPDDEATRRAKRAKAVIERIRAKLGDESAMLLDNAASRPRIAHVIPTGIEVVDRHVLGCGGLPGGRISEVFSEEGVGKTSFMYGCLASAQVIGGVAMMIETEHGFDPERAADPFGCDLDTFGMSQPRSIEQATQIVEAAVEGADPKVPMLIAWDTLAATPTEREVVEGLSGKAKIAERARAMSEAMRILAAKVAKSNAHLMIVNQIRDNIGVIFGASFTTPGGHAVKFHASQRIQLFGGKAVKKGDEHIGKTITFLGIKNRFAPPFRKVRVRLNYADGWDDGWSLCEHAKNLGLLPARSKVTAKNIEIARKKLGYA